MLYFDKRMQQSAHKFIPVFEKLIVLKSEELSKSDQSELMATSEKKWKTYFMYKSIGLDPQNKNGKNRSF